jgi:hypothetical protein
MAFFEWPEGHLVEIRAEIEPFLAKCGDKPRGTVP